MALIAAVEALAWLQGCTRIEVTNGDHRPDAHASYERLGYKIDCRRFITALAKLSWFIVGLRTIMSGTTKRWVTFLSIVAQQLAFGTAKCRGLRFLILQLGLPAGLIANMGQPVALSVSVQSAGDVSYQWFLNGDPVSSATQGKLSIPVVAAAHAGSYAVEVSNAAGMVQSQIAVLTENSTTPIDLEQWITRNPLSPEETIWAITKAGDGLLAVGNKGTIRTSEDGIHWTSRSLGTTQFLLGVAWNGSQFVMIDDFGTISTSPNGIVWTTRYVATNQIFTGLTWGGGLFVAVGTGGSILTSPDGVAWTARNSGTSESLLCVAWSGSEYIATGNTGTVVTSPDGIAWASRNSGTSESLLGVTWNGSQYVAVGAHAVILTSPNGINWTTRDSGVTAYYLENVAWNGSLFVAVGTGGTLVTSPDGVTWTTQSSGTTQQLVDVIWTGSQFVAVGQSGTILISAEGINWTLKSVSSGTWLHDIIWDGNKFVATGTNGTILTSPNGIAWARRDSGTTADLRRIYRNGGFYATVGSSGTLLISQDGLDWNLVNTGTVEFLSELACGATQWVAVGFYGTILTSDNLTNWTQRNEETGAHLISVASGPSRFVAVGNSGTILTSESGVSWTPCSSGTADSLLRVIWHYDQFIVVGTNGTVLTSPDGVAWTPRSSGTTAWLDDVIWDGNQFVAVGGLGTVLTSPDGVTWNSHTSGTTQELIGVARNDSQFVLVGRDNTLLTTLTLPTITAQPQTQTANVGQSVSFSVADQSPDSVSYQWRLNGNAIAGAVSDTYTVQAVLSADAGSYTVTITNTSGTTTSAAAVLSVTGLEQSIDFPAVSDWAFTFNPVALGATASSGLPVSLEVVSGPAVVTTSTLAFTGVGNVTIRASQAGGSGYLAAAPVERIFAVSPNFAFWQFTNFTSEEMTDESISGPNAATDEGIPNLLRYALGLGRSSLAGSDMPTISTDGTNWIYLYKCPSDLLDVIYTVQCSEDLDNWSGSGITVIKLSAENGTDLWQASYPVDSAPNLFFRLMVSLIE